jgi:transglutaminase-like putative cysteine protease
MTELMLNPPPELCLQSTSIIDSEHPQIVAFTHRLLGQATKDPAKKAVRMYQAVRDSIWYDPYFPFYLPQHYQASFILEQKRGYCVSKASLLCALGRAAGIPSRVGFATVKNHLATRQLLKFIGSDLFVYHGFVEFYLEGRWVKATPTFNKELCERHQVPPLDFNGREDALFQAYNIQNQRFMDYVDYHGTYADIPVDKIVDAWKTVYGKARVTEWIRLHEKFGGLSIRDFYTEEPLIE